MAWKNKVIWSEGMFLRPQHFQQHDRYIEHLINSRCTALRGQGWGVSELRFDEEMLALGKLSIVTARGILPDGTPFNIPEVDDPPPPLDLPADVTNTTVALVLPIERMGAVESADARIDGQLIRYVTDNAEVSDNSRPSRESADVLVGVLALSLSLMNEASAASVQIPVARVIERRSDGSASMDETFIPACLTCRANSRLKGFLTEILGLLRHRGEALAGRVTHAGRGGVSELADYMLLQVINRSEPLFGHLEQSGQLHPEEFFRIAAQLSGELATFTHPDRRPVALPHYAHDDLRAVFDPLMAELRRSLSMVLEQNAIQLPLEERKYGIRVAMIADREMLTTANLVLAVSADMSTELLIQQFPRQIKIGSAETIADLVNLALPGIAIRQLPVAPREIPFHAGFCYFEIDKKNESWPELLRSGALALHIGGDIPGVQLQLWAIRG